MKESKSSLKKIDNSGGGENLGVQVSKAKPIQMLKAQPEPKRNKNKIDWKKAKFVAEYFGVSLSTVSIWTNRLEDPLPSRRLSGVLQYDFEKIKEWEERNSN